jgi:hypothetical protein
MSESKWIHGTDMKDIDKLSRRKEQDGPHAMYAPNIPEDKLVRLDIHRLMVLCDPYANRSSVEDYNTAFLEVHEFLSNSFLKPSPEPPFLL